MRIYLAGPMRGIPEFNFPAFDETAARGRALGHEIISPADMDREHGFNAQGQDGKVNDLGHSETVTLDFMRAAASRDFRAIVGSTVYRLAPADAVAMMPGWEGSRGARAEKAIAEWIGITVLDAMTFEPLGAKPTAETLIQNGEFVVKDSGRRDSFSTGAQRDGGDGKGFFHCIPFIGLSRLAKLYEAGAKKYGRDNWKRGIPLSRYIDSIYRHLGKLAEGWKDEDHAAAIAWNALGFIWTAERVQTCNLPAELDDLNFVKELSA